MIKAVFKQGAIQLLQPPPAEWIEGKELDVKPSNHSVENIGWLPPISSLEQFDEENLSQEEIETLFAELEEMCSASDPQEDDRMMKALDEHRAEQKERMRVRMERE